MSATENEDVQTTTADAPPADMSWADAQKPSTTSSGLPVIMRADIYESPEVFGHAQRVARSLAASSMVPRELQRSLPDALAALALAREMNLPPLMVMQNIYFVNGKAGWSTQFMIARANMAGVFSKSIKWRTSKTANVMEMKVEAYATMDGEEISVEATMQMAVADGWTKNKKYQSMPEHMLRWRSATMLIKLYCPQVMYGLPMVDELEDDVVETLDVTPGKSTLDVFAGSSGGAGPSPVDTKTVKEGEVQTPRKKREPKPKDAPVVEAAQAVAETVRPDEPQATYDAGTDENTLACPYCDKKLRDDDALAVHINVLHEEEVTAEEEKAAAKKKADEAAKVEAAKPAETPQAISSGGERVDPAQQQSDEPKVKERVDTLIEGMKLMVNPTQLNRYVASTSSVVKKLSPEHQKRFDDAHTERVRSFKRPGA